MNKIKQFIWILPLLAAISSCDFEESPAKVLPAFNRISSNGSVTFNLISGVENKVISTTLSESYYSVSGGQLNVNAPGGSMTVAIKDLDLLWCNACKVENPEPFVVDTLNIYVHGGSMDLKDIQVNSRFDLQAVNTGKYKVSGQAGFFYVSSVNTTSIEAFNLVTDSTYVSTTSIADTEVHATQVLKGNIMSLGDILYKGNPSTVKVSGNGGGKAISK